MKIKSFIGGLSVKQNKRLPQLSRKVYKLKGLLLFLVQDKNHLHS